MIYVVSGPSRSGTSMMMQALKSGGMELAYAESAERLNDNGNPDYKPNAGGFFEISGDEYGSENWPLQYEGKLIKVLSRRVGSMFRGVSQMEVNPSGYLIAWMTRDSEEIRQSWNISGLGPPMRQADADNIDRQQSLCFRHAQNRHDVESVIPIHFRDVLQDKLDERPRTFSFLMSMGWPVDPRKALEAVIVDEEHYRCRLHDLGPLKANLTPEMIPL